MCYDCDLDDDSSELHVDAEVQTEIESLEKGTNTELQTAIEKRTNTINYITDQPLTITDQPKEAYNSN